MPRYDNEESEPIPIPSEDLPPRWCPGVLADESMEELKLPMELELEPPIVGTPKPEPGRVVLVGECC